MNSSPAIKLAPSILTADFGHLADQLHAVEAAGANYVHLDIMDGRFVPNISFGPMLVRAVRSYTKLPLDVHLMIEEPDRYIDAFAEAGADLLTVHVETCPHLHRTIQQINDAGCRAGITLNPATGIESVREILPFVDMVLVMSVNPGFGSQRFIETTTSKLRRMRRLMSELNPTADLEVDGGVNAQNIGDIVRSGANVIVVGSSVFNRDASVGENIADLRAGYANAGVMTI